MLGVIITSSPKTRSHHSFLVCDNSIILEHDYQVKNFEKIFTIDHASHALKEKSEFTKIYLNIH